MKHGLVFIKEFTSQPLSEDIDNPVGLQITHIFSLSINLDLKNSEIQSLNEV